MIGAIIGDIAGSDYEFNNTFDYNFPIFAPYSDFTDDTICSVAVADAIMNKGIYASTMKKWCRKYPNPKGAYGTSFARWVMCNDTEPYGSYGNGAAMRVNPVAWLFDDEEAVRREARATAAISHSHPEGLKGAEAIAVAIFRMHKAQEKDPGIFTQVATEFYGPEAFSHLPRKGYFDVTCMGCVPLSLKIAAEAESFEDAIRLAVSYGGDTDTVGAIVGSLAESRFPIPDELKTKALAFLPQEMLDIIDQFEKARIK